MVMLMVRRPLTRKGNDGGKWDSHFQAGANLPPHFNVADTSLCRRYLLKVKSKSKKLKVKSKMGFPLSSRSKVTSAPQCHRYYSLS